MCDWFTSMSVRKREHPLTNINKINVTGKAKLTVTTLQVGVVKETKYDTLT